MDQDLAFREYRLPWKGIAALAGASIAVYAAVAYAGVAAVCGIAGLTVGYLVARTTKI
jgi:hypothetical protein